ncbi:MAG TPA: dihydrofolate reductase family protein [Opitutaceae bacterium]|nr:dihydrofolate reductase family protein [Opitutaceae bacterium]
MPRLIVYNNVSLDGYFTDAKNDMSWAHRGHEDPEWVKYVAGNAKGGGRLVFGRVTYEMMASFWPTPMAAKGMPVVAEKMNSCGKIVFSRTLRKAEWYNTMLIKRNLVAEIRRLKAEPGEDLVILGSGSLVSQLAAKGLVDEFQVVVVPIVLGAGRTMFDGMKSRQNLRLLKTRTFKNGNVVMFYAPAA